MRVTAGKKSLEDGAVDVRDRATGEERRVNAGRPLMPRKRRFSDEPFGPTIQRLMAEQDVTYRALADKTGLSAGYLNHLVHGNRPVPSDDVIAELGGALGVEPEHFREVRIRRIAERLETMPDLDLIGCPVRVTAGRKSLEDGAVDIRDRATGEERRLKVEDL